MNVRILLSGRHYESADSIPSTLSLPDGCTVDDALERVLRLLPSESRLPDSCLVTVSGRHLGTLRSHRSDSLVDGDELVLIAPVAGG